MQSVDFKFNDATRCGSVGSTDAGTLKRRRPNGQPPESPLAWAHRQVASNMKMAYSHKKGEYKTYEPYPDYDTPVQFLVFSTRGTPTEDASKWLASFPLDLMQALRRAIAFTLQLLLNHGVRCGLSREW